MLMVGEKFSAVLLAASYLRHDVAGEETDRKFSTDCQFKTCTCYVSHITHSSERKLKKKSP
jgi:hypothetical protein